MSSREAEGSREYIISRIETDDEELDAFLFSPGCCSGEPVVSIKDGRYSIYSLLAEAIIVEEKSNSACFFYRHLVSML